MCAWASEESRWTGNKPLRVQGVAWHFLMVCKVLSYALAMPVGRQNKHRCVFRGSPVSQGNRLSDREVAEHFKFTLFGAGWDGNPSFLSPV